MTRHFLHHRPAEGPRHGGGADQYRGPHPLHHGGQIDAAVGVAPPVPHLGRIAGQQCGSRAELRHVAQQQTRSIDRPDALPSLPFSEAGAPQQAHQALGDAASGGAGTEHHDALIAQGLPQSAAGGQHGGAGDATGALNVIVKAGQLPAVTLQQQAGVAVAEVLPVQTGTGTFQLHSLDEFIDKCQVGIPLQSRLPQAWIEGIGQQTGVIGAHIEHHRQHPLGIESGAEGIDGQLALADVDASHPLIANAEDPF